MPVIFVVEGKCPAQPSVSQVLRSEGYFVLPLTSTTEALQTLACVRPNLVVVDDRGARAAAASLRAALGDAAHQVPVMVVHHDAIEDHSICEPAAERCGHAGRPPVGARPTTRRPDDGAIQLKTAGLRRSRRERPRTRTRRAGMQGRVRNTWEGRSAQGGTDRPARRTTSSAASRGTSASQQYDDWVKEKPPPEFGEDDIPM